MGNRRKRKQSKDTDHEEASGDDGKGAHQRPNCCDTCMLALVCFFLVVVIGVSIPLIFTATGSMDIEFISEKLKTLRKPSSK